MTTAATFALRYLLPSSITLSATLRLAVVVDPAGGHLEPEVEVALSASWRATRLVGTRRIPSPVAPGADPLESHGAPGSLQVAFARRHPHTAALIADLSSRAEQYLAGLRMDEESDTIVLDGRALEIVHRELAAADRTRREWIARQERELRTTEWEVSPVDLVTLPEVRQSLPGDLELPSALARSMADDFGLLIAISGENQDGVPGTGAGPAALHVYRRPPRDLPDHPAGADAEPWHRDEALSRLRVSDSAEAMADLPHQRGSRSDAGAAHRSPLPPAPDREFEAAVRAARVQLALLDTSDEYTRLSCAQHRDAEIAALRHAMELGRPLHPHRAG